MDFRDLAITGTAGKSIPIYNRLATGFPQRSRKGVLAFPGFKLECHAFDILPSILTFLALFNAQLSQIPAGQTTIGIPSLRQQVPLCPLNA